jgi:DNA-binding response OmpR family regulator
MHIAIETTSASVRQTLESIILAAGHQLAGTEASPQLTLVDSQHLPPHATIHGAVLTLVGGAATQPDDQITCPVRPQQLVQRLMHYRPPQTVALGHGWSLDRQARQLIHAAHAAVTLTEKESLLLATLAQAASQPLTREALLAHVWGVAEDIDTHTLETHIYRLRAKLAALAPAPFDITTRNGAYLLALGDNHG